MKSIHRATIGLSLVLALTVSTSCQGITHLGRPALEPGQDEFVAEVERLDTSAREIHFRPNNSPTRVVGYSADALVVFSGHDYPVTQLAAGDIVGMRLRQDSHGNSYTDLLRLQESSRDWAWGAITRPGNGIQTVDGSVNHVNIRRTSFEIHDQSRRRIFVFLPDNARRSVVDSVRALRAGDYVRVEGRFLDGDQFRLENFLGTDR